MVAAGEPQKIKILIVEKHAAVRRALRRRLSATPRLEVVGAVADPASALGKLDTPGAPEVQDVMREEPDVILLGLQNGSDEDLFQTVEAVQRLVRRPAAVVVLAPYADEVERVLLQQAGAKRYLLKHIDSLRLIEEIEAAAVDDARYFPVA